MRMSERERQRNLMITAKKFENEIRKYRVLLEVVLGFYENGEKIPEATAEAIKDALDDKK